MAVAIWITGFLLLWAPGFLILRGLGVMRREDPVVRLAIEIALGLCAWPVAMLVTSTIGIAWSTAGTRLVALAVLLGVSPPTSAAFLRWFKRRRGRRRHTVVLLLLAAAVVSRLIHIRNLAFPPWIDSVHHGMIIRLFIDQGRIPATCDPYIPGAAFYYHWGYHSTAATLARVLGLTRAGDIPALMLLYGQLLNVLSVITIYAAGRVATRSRMAGLFAATFAMFASWYPAYYLSWGRYTHLAGTLILPPLLIVLWRIAQGRRERGYVVAAAILAAGLVLIHVRIAFFAAVFALLLIPVAFQKHRVKPVLHTLFAGLLALVVVAPWLVRVVRNPYVQDFVRPGEVSTDDYYQAIPFDLLRSNRDLFSIATGGLSGVAGIFGMPAGGRILSAMWIAALVWALSKSQKDAEPRRRAIRARPPKRIGRWPALVFIAGYVIVISVLLTWQPLTRFASPASAVMTLFLPLSIIGGALAAWFIGRVAPRFAFAAMAVIVLLGFWKYFDVVNPQTIFADHRDRRALVWIQSNTPPNALFAIDGRPWTVKPAWAGIDGGYWINVATDRKTILPPSIYAWSLPPDQVAKINTAVEKWSFANDPGSATHIYVGSRLEEKRRAALISDPRAHVIYRDGPVAVLERVRDASVEVTAVEAERRIDRIR